MGQGLIIRNPTPRWLTDPSVTDSAMTKALRMIGQLIGADDPTSQVLGIMSTLVPSAGKAGGAVAKVIEKVKGIKAYHGSPHDFDKFSMEKIGTGEGAQAYGHGLYMAEAPDVARGYRDQVPVGERVGGVLDTNMRVAGKPVQDLYSAIENRAARLPISQANAEYDKLSVLEDLMHQGDALAVRERGTHSPEAMAWFERDIVPKFTRRGKLYEVNINADPETFLDWDAPVSKQPVKAQELVRGALKKAGYLRPNDNGPRQLEAALREWKMAHGGMAETRMESLLSGRGNLLGDTPAEMSSRLREAGIPGIKYLDQGSRATGEGSRNYVVFDDSIIDILKKYGLLPAAVGTGAAMSQEQTR